MTPWVIPLVMMVEWARALLAGLRDAVLWAMLRDDLADL
jgi:hypothetical protein